MTSEENNKNKIASPNNILLEALKKKKEKLASGSRSFKGGPTGDKYSGKGKNFSPAGAGNSIGHRPTGR